MYKVIIERKLKLMQQNYLTQCIFKNIKAFEIKYCIEASYTNFCTLQIKHNVQEITHINIYIYYNIKAIKTKANRFKIEINGLDQVLLEISETNYVAESNTKDRVVT